MNIRTRFAPSPTGFLHVGGLRTALYAYLFARKNDGQFLLRIEDTDQGRLVEGSIENIISSLKWAGISIDEGVDTDETDSLIQKGSYGPYIQSERLANYQKHVQTLLQSGNAYYCFCTKERLDELRAMQESAKQPTMYDGHCRDISLAEALKRVQAGETSVVRMVTPKEGKTIFTDLIRGEVSFENALIDDQVLIKSDGFPTYHLAAVVDDHDMEISHVFRAEEWLPSTPKHIMLYKMFGWPAPEFAHLSWLINEQKQKLSKRHGDVSVEDFKQGGYLPEALVNFVAFLGWNPGTERELFTIKDLEKEFSIERVTKAAAVFNREKLNWYNQQYIRQLSGGQLLERASPFLMNAGLVNEQTDRTWLEKAIALEKERVNTLKELPEAIAFLFAETLIYDPELLVWKKSTREQTKQILFDLLPMIETISEPWDAKPLEEKVRAWIAEKGYQTGDALWPMRVALSGQKNSPGPFEIASVLGKDKTLTRLHQAFSSLI